MTEEERGRERVPSHSKYGVSSYPITSCYLFSFLPFVSDCTADNNKIIMRLPPLLLGRSRLAAVVVSSSNSVARFRPLSVSQRCLEVAKSGRCRRHHHHHHLAESLKRRIGKKEREKEGGEESAQASEQIRHERGMLRRPQGPWHDKVIRGGINLCYYMKQGQKTKTLKLTRTTTQSCCQIIAFYSSKLGRSVNILCLLRRSLEFSFLYSFYAVVSFFLLALSLSLFCFRATGPNKEQKKKKGLSLSLSLLSACLRMNGAFPCLCVTLFSALPLVR